MTLTMAWRNLWRRPRRTLVILLAVVIGVWSMVFYSAFIRGMIDEMVQQSIANLTGHIQVQAVGFFENPVIEHRIHNAPQVAREVEELLPEGARWTMRLRTNAVVRSARRAVGGTLVGVVPESEVGVSFVGEPAMDATVLNHSSDGILVGHALLDQLDLRVGYRIVVDMQNAAGVVISRAFVVVGEYRAELEATEKQLLFCRRDILQTALGVGDDVSEIAIVLPRREDVDTVASALRDALGEGTLRVLTWREIVPFVGAWLDSMGVYGMIWNSIVFVAMSFGLINAILMAVFERIREFGLVRALGVTPRGVVLGVMVETLMLLVIGFGIGAGLGLGTVAWLAHSGIDLSMFAAGSEYFGMSRVLYPQANLADFLRAGGTVFVLGALVALYPAIKAARVTPVQAMAHV